MKGEGIRQLLFLLDFVYRTWFANPASPMRCYLRKKDEKRNLRL